VKFGRRCGRGQTKSDVAEADMARNHVAGHVRLAGAASDAAAARPNFTSSL
jgi:hypothetical protein